MRGALTAVTDLADLVEGDAETADEDEIAAAHYSMFGFNVFPHASVFLEEDGFLGKGVTESARAFYERSGLFESDGREAADHITTELLFCSRISDNAREMARFCDRHLFAWLPTFVFAIERQNNPFYRRLARLTLDVITAHRKSLLDQKSPLDQKSLLDQKSPSEYHVDPHQSSSSVQSVCRDDSILKKQWTDQFSVAGKCGLFLSRGDIMNLARALRLPTGFGGRIQMLRTMFDSSETYGREKDVAAGLLHLCDQEITSWQAVLDDNPPVALVVWSEQWLAKLRSSRNLVQENQHL